MNAAFCLPRDRPVSKAVRGDESADWAALESVAYRIRKDCGGVWGAPGAFECGTC